MTHAAGTSQKIPIMKRMVVAAAGAGLLLITGCGDDRSVGPGGTDGGLPDGRTFLSTSVVEGDVPRSLAEGTRIRLDFGDGQLSVEAGCNYLGFGKVRKEDDRLVVDQASGTDIGCSQERMDQDDWLLGFLTSEPTLRLDGDTLRLTSAETTIELLDIEVATPDRPLVGTRWRINSIIDGESVNSYNADAEAYLVFGDDGKVSGHTACNSFTARYEVDGSTLSVSGLTATDAPCWPDAAELEAALLEVLHGDSTIDIETSQLTLTAADGKGVSLNPNL